jgi:isochorismate synthase
LKVSTENTASFQKEITLELLWESAVNQQFATVIWRLPKQNSFHFLADISGKPSKSKINFEELESGFCISPFINADGNETLLLKNDYHFVFRGNNKTIENQDFNLSEKLFLEKAIENFISINLKYADPKIVVNQSVDEEIKFEEIIVKAKTEIEQKAVQKVVLSRMKTVKIDGHISIVETFNKLSEKYPNAFISAIYLPENNCIWLGASPELLVSLDENGVFRTMSLAGTQRAYEKDGTKILPNNARWSQKEIEEQAFVSRYIIECFKKVRVREYIENGPKTVEAGNLLHLQTDYTVDTNAIEFKQFATVLLELLHPTSAVCGMPKATAMDFILKNENYNREFYSGFLGPVNIAGASNIFVNLRSLKLADNQAFVFAGAGITEDSVPENEWVETELKMQTLLSVLNEIIDPQN